jgi:hypothetical protein
LFLCLWNSASIERKVLAMKGATVALLLIAFVIVGAAQSGQPDSDKAQPPRVMCDAAASKLQKSGTSKVVLMMTLDTQGRVESFKTESPKGLRLEKVKEAASAIRAIHFRPAAKDGSPVAVRILVEFDCANQQTSKIT